MRSPILIFCATVLIACGHSKPKVAVDKEKQEIIYYENIAIKNKNARAIFLKGLEKIQASNYSEAMEFFLKANNLEKNNAVILNAMGKTEASLDHSAIAESYYRRALQSDSGYVHTYINYALLLNKQKNYRAAEAQLRSIPPKQGLDSTIYASWHFALAVSYFGQSRCAESMRQVEEAGNYVNREDLIRELRVFKQKVVNECKTPQINSAYTQ